ncbi:MAG TPA: YaeQ family protein [Pseudomonadales bacterium]|nr:YaeQ family protein [Pseudomonadales bacterium]
MATKATIYKACMNISDMDRHYYATHNLTLACHPSETEERMMVRLYCFAAFASDSLQFTRGISTEDEPDLWDKDLTDAITHWIEVGVPDESRIRKGSNRSGQITVVCYGARNAMPWWEKNREKLARFNNLAVWFLSKDITDGLAAMASRNMDLQVSIQDGQAWISSADKNIAVTPEIWKARS